MDNDVVELLVLLAARDSQKSILWKEIKLKISNLPLWTSNFFKFSKFFKISLFIYLLNKQKRKMVADAMELLLLWIVMDFRYSNFDKTA